jgi:hypothetical protein
MGLSGSFGGDVMSADSISVMIAVSIVAYLIISFWKQIAAVVAACIVVIFVYGLVEVVGQITQS